MSSSKQNLKTKKFKRGDLIGFIVTPNATTGCNVTLLKMNFEREIF